MTANEPLKNIYSVCQKYGVNTAKYEPAVKKFMEEVQFHSLMEERNTKSGDELLKVVLAAVLGLAEHVHNENLRHGVKDNKLVIKTRESLTLLLSQISY